MLFGRLTEEEALVKRIVMASNELKSTVRFEIDPKKVVDSFTEMERDDLDFIGFFHSHPTAATPSSMDLKYMKLEEMPHG